MDWNRLFQESNNQALIRYAKSEGLDRIYSDDEICDFINGRTNGTGKIIGTGIANRIRAGIAEKLYNLADAIYPEFS